MLIYLNKRQLLEPFKGKPNDRYRGDSSRGNQIAGRGSYRPTDANLLQALGCPLPQKPVVVV